jgi:hypothetical protein
MGDRGIPHELQGVEPGGEAFPSQCFCFCKEKKNIYKNNVFGGGGGGSKFFGGFSPFAGGRGNVKRGRGVFGCEF